MSAHSEATVAPTAPRRRRPSVARNLWWMVLPALSFYIFMVIIPTGQGIQMSLTNWSAQSRDRSFVGLANYGKVLSGSSGDAIVQTLILAAATMAIQIVLGLMLALALDGPIRGRTALRTIIFSPVVVSALVVGYLFKYIFGPQDIGALNSLLSAVGMPQHDWLGDPNTALAIIVITVSWQFTGIAMVIFLAGLQGVPKELHEAAALDGASTFERFRHVTVPLLAPAFTIVLMLSLIGGLKIFDQIFAMTSGGPAGATETISTLIFRKFSMLGQYGQSAALAVLLAIAVAVLSLVQFSVLRRREVSR